MSDLEYAPGYKPQPIESVTIEPVRELEPTEQITGIFKAIEGTRYTLWFVVENWDTASHPSETNYVGAKLVDK